jgi:hypothetical protein
MIRKSIIASLSLLILLSSLFADQSDQVFAALTAKNDEEVTRLLQNLALPQNFDQLDKVQAKNPELFSTAYFQSLTLSWTDQKAAGSRYWQSIASSVDGTRLAAAASGEIYTSSDAGATWTDQKAAGRREWKSIASSADGTCLAAAAFGDIYTSSDAGATWTDQKAAGSRYWQSIASSADGSRLAAVDKGDIWTTKADQ